MGTFYKHAYYAMHFGYTSQLKQHGLNDKMMLDEVIMELTTKGSNDQTTSEDMLIWAKRVEAQRMQAAILSDIIGSQRFD